MSLHSDLGRQRQAIWRSHTTPRVEIWAGRPKSAASTARPARPAQSDVACSHPAGQSLAAHMRFITRPWLLQARKSNFQTSMNLMRLRKGAEHVEQVEERALTHSGPQVHGFETRRATARHGPRPSSLPEPFATSEYALRSDFVRAHDWETDQGGFKRRCAREAHARFG